MSAQPLYAPPAWPVQAPSPKVIPGGYRSPDQSRVAPKAPLHATLPGLQHFPRSSWLVWAGSAVLLLSMQAAAGSLRAMNTAAHLKLQSVREQVHATQDETIALQRQYRAQVRKRNDLALVARSDASLVASGAPLEVTVERFSYHPAAYSPATE